MSWWLVTAIALLIVVLGDGVTQLALRVLVRRRRRAEAERIRRERAERRARLRVVPSKPVDESDDDWAPHGWVG